MKRGAAIFALIKLLFSSNC